MQGEVEGWSSQSLDGGEMYSGMCYKGFLLLSPDPVRYTEATIMAKRGEGRAGRGGGEKRLTSKLFLDTYGTTASGGRKRGGGLEIVGGIFGGGGK